MKYDRLYVAKFHLADMIASLWILIIGALYVFPSDFCWVLRLFCGLRRLVVARASIPTSEAKGPALKRRGKVARRGGIPEFS
jgi:hypothetical protein